VSRSAARSKRPNGTGSRRSPRFFSQLVVKLGTMRPPTKVISATRTAMPRRMPAAPVAARPIASRCTSALASSSVPSARQNRKVARVPSDHDFAPDGGEKGDEKREIEHRGDERIGPRRERDRRPTGKPERPEPCQRQPLERHASGPVGHGGQKEASHRRCGEAKQHLMRMPSEGIEGRRQHDRAPQHRQPEHERADSPKAGGEKKGPKALLQQGRSLPDPVTRDAPRPRRHHSSHAPTSATRIGRIRCAPKMRAGALASLRGRKEVGISVWAWADPRRSRARHRARGS
jgi:hypothetical protein